MNQGNGSDCDDVDECQEQGGQHGHHCPTEHARCPNKCHHDNIKIITKIIKGVGGEGGVQYHQDLLTY